MKEISLCQSEEANSKDYHTHVEFDKDAGEMSWILDYSHPMSVPRGRDIAEALKEIQAADSE
ncbi:hypothetical protein KI387_040378, partial [Taxus chinensis]